MYNNNILNLQESATILNTCTKKSGNLLNVLCKSLAVGVTSEVGLLLTDVFQCYLSASVSVSISVSETRYLLFFRDTGSNMARATIQQNGIGDSSSIPG